MQKLTGTKCSSWRFVLRSEGTPLADSDRVPKTREVRILCRLIQQLGSTGLILVRPEAQKLAEFANP
jgi:hypothetical protein